MRLRFGLVDGRNRTYTQIGQELGVHRTTASRTLARALGKLRYPSRFIGPLDF